MATCGDYCDRCAEEIEALEVDGAREQAKREARELARLFRRQEPLNVGSRRRAWARRWVWAPFVVFGIGCALYLGFVLGAMFLNWIGER
jgi:hypothetical protein